MDWWQVVSLLGSLGVLFAYVASQARRMDPRSRAYTSLNFMGSALLALVAVVERQWGFLLLEGVWALVSLYTLLRPGQAGH